MTAPPLPFLPERYHGTKVLSLLQAHVGTIAEGERTLAPLRRFGAPIGDGVVPRRYVEAQGILDAVYDKGARNYWSAQNFADLDDPVPETLVALAATMPTPESDILISQLGGAINDVASDATAYPHRETAFAITPGARWRDQADDATCIAWIREAADRLAPHAQDGVYVNFVSEAEGREVAAYGQNHPRLSQLKSGYDPGNRFRWNQNIKPRDR